MRTANNQVWLNGAPIKFRRVNRHDSGPVTGFSISIDQARRDLELMKRHNFNAIRTSHYRNAPWFCQLCDQYGFYVIDEADHESHGAGGRGVPVLGRKLRRHGDRLRSAVRAGWRRGSFDSRRE